MVFRYTLVETPFQPKLWTARQAGKRVETALTEISIGKALVTE
jgi:hypothetical protein